MSILTKIFGDANQKIINQLQGRVDEINKLENKFKKFSNADFKRRTEEFRKKLKDKTFDEQQKILDDILPEAFAMVREVAKRTLGQRHYDVQLIAGIVLHQGNIAEMKTGEGKTLAATTAVYLNALTGRGVHVVTVNDYLARRDTVWMGQIYDLLGMTVGCLNHESAYLYDPSFNKSEIRNPKSEANSKFKIQNSKNRDSKLDLDQERDELGSFKVFEEFLRPVERKQAYAADITYGTNNEFGFDYLRDNMVQSLEQKVQRELHYAIVDEVDSILIDEARTPLIISAPDAEPTEKYIEFDRMVKKLKEGEDYNVDEKMKAVTLTEEGIRKLEKMMGIGNIYTDRGIREVHHIEQALKANCPKLFKKDINYVVKDGEVIIVDEFTGRLMFGRRYSDGLHQAIEAKEGVEIKQESITMATITFQNYFRMYRKLAGMTGTAATEAEEFSKIYNLDVIVIPTNKPMIRQDKPDVIFKTQKEKYKAIVEEIKSRHELGQPVLVGTISIENNEHLSHMLSREGVEHKVLNAKHHEKEGEIIAQAGRKGAVTIATNMAGRGVDIVLGGNPPDPNEQKEVLALGGLHVIGTERHESRRIDNQLRGRAGRQGDPGSSQFFVSMEDDLMRIFGGERMKSIMQTLGVPDGMPIENKMISRSIEKAQRKVEGHNFDIRKHLVEYDDVINKHREVIYKKRNEILGLGNKEQGTRDKEQETREMGEGARNKDLILEYIKDEIENVVNFHTQTEDENSWNLEEIYETMDTIFPVPLEVRIKLEEIKETANKKQLTINKNKGQSTREQLIDYLYDLAVKEYNKLEERINNDENLKNQIQDNQEPMRVIEKMILLRSIDMLWVEHIDAMDHMRQGIGLRGYGQKDPLVEYKKEAHRMFQKLLANIRKQVVYSIFKVGLVPVPPVEQQKGLEMKGAAKTSDEVKKLETRPDIKPGSPLRFENQKLGEGKTSFSGPAGVGAVSSTSSIKPAPVERQEKKKKIGRNDPCPCGSGKKYKKCCGA